MTKRTRTGTSRISARLLVTRREINLVQRECLLRGRAARDGLLKSAIHHVLGFVGALALCLGMVATAQAQWCAGYPPGFGPPCYKVDVQATGYNDNFIDQTSTSPFKNSTSWSDPGNTGNQSFAESNAQFNSVTALATADAFADCSPNCGVAAFAFAEYADVVDLKGYADGDMLQFTWSVHGSFVFPPITEPDQGFAQGLGRLTFINGENSGFVQLGGSPSSFPNGVNISYTLTVQVYPSIDPFGQLLLGSQASAILYPGLGGLGSAITDFSATTKITNVALLDPDGNFLGNIVLTDLAGFTLPGPGPGTAPEPATLLLVASALAVLGTLSRRTRAN